MSGIAERYSRASKSSHLKMEVEPGDVDVLIAAGLADSLGTLLLRCRQEWDSQRAEMERMHRVLRSDREAAEGIRKQTAEDEEERDEFAEESRRAFKRAEETLRTSRALMMMGMLSLSSAREALRNYALIRMYRKNLDIDKHHHDIVDDALDVWLDQRCDACCGRGFNGGYGAPVLNCRPCRASGKRRRVFPSRTSDAYALGEWLIAEADRMVQAAQRKMQRALR